MKPVLLFLISSIAAASTWYWAAQTDALRHELRTRWIGRAVISSTPQQQSLDDGNDRDFTAELPLPEEAPFLELRAVRTAHEAATRHKVEFVREQLHRREASHANSLEASGTALSRVEVSLLMRGDYVALKAAFDEVFQRMQPAVYRELSLVRAEGGGAALEARGVLLLPLRPASGAMASLNPALTRR